MFGIKPDRRSHHMRKINNSLAAWYAKHPPRPWSAIQINKDMYTIYNGEAFAGWVRREAEGWQADSVKTPLPDQHAFKQTARDAAQAVFGDDVADLVF